MLVTQISACGQRARAYPSSAHCMLTSVNLMCRELLAHVSRARLSDALVALQLPNGMFQKLSLNVSTSHSRSSHCQVMLPPSPSGSLDACGSDHR